MSGRIRYLLIMLIFVVSAVVYIDRSNISIAGTYLAQDYHISKIQLGWVFSAFLLGYAAFQIPDGWVVGGVGLGSGLAPPLVAAIIAFYGWHEVFYISAVIGLVVAAIWYYVA